jgi:hypothetical protein
MAQDVRACEREIELTLGQLHRIEDVVAKFLKKAEDLVMPLVEAQSQLHELMSNWGPADEWKALAKSMEE